MNTNSRFSFALKRVLIFAGILLTLCLLSNCKPNKSVTKSFISKDSVKITDFHKAYQSDSLLEIQRSIIKDYQYSGVLLPNTVDSIINKDFTLKLEPLQLHQPDGSIVNITRWKVIYKDTSFNNSLKQVSKIKDTVKLDKKSISILEDKEKQVIKKTGPSYHFWVLIALLVGCTIIYLWAKIY